MRSIDMTVASADVVAKYDVIIDAGERTAVRPGLRGNGLFVVAPVARGRLVIEYTGKRRRAADVDMSKAAIDCYGK